jgi:hypothetical protein
MALGSTQPLTEMSTRNLLGVNGGRPSREADNFTAICEPTVQKMWEPRRLTTLWASMACYGHSFTFLPYQGQLYLYHEGTENEKSADLYWGVVQFESRLV